MTIMQQQPQADTLWYAWFDGSSAPNPGKMGVGIVLIAPNGECTEKSQALQQCGCNNEAELHALALTLELAALAGAMAIKIQGDSKAAVDWVNGADSTKIEPLAELVTGIREQQKRFASVSLSWIPRHKNKDADRLSRRALGLSETEPPAKPGRRKRR
jgi:ribonuclease HI